MCGSTNRTPTRDLVTLQYYSSAEAQNACGQPLPLWQKAAAGLTAGGLGALVGSPADLTLIRMQADNTMPVASRRNYKNVGDAMARSLR